MSRILVELIVPGAVLIVGVLLEPPTSKWLIAALAVAIGVSASTLIALLLSRYHMQRTETVIHELEAAVSEHLADVSAAALIRAQGRDGMTQEQLSEYESRIDVETVWIVGEDFNTEVEPEAPFLQVVRKRIHERKTKYVYIAPHSPDLKHMFDRLREELEVEEGDERMKTVLLKPDEWQGIPYKAGNFTIYDPVRKGVLPHGYCWDPGGDGSSFIELRHKVSQWVGEIQEICPQLDPNSSSEEAQQV